jgi:hypothetical protein
MPAWSRIGLALAALLLFSVPLPAAAQSDTTPPHLVSLSVSPNEIDASSSSVDIVITAVITDDLSGLSYEGDSTTGDYTSAAQLYSPSGNQFVTGCPCFMLVSGDTYTQTLSFPQYAEEGIWKDWSFFLADEAGNWVYVYDNNLMAAGINQAVGVDPFDPSYSRTISLKLSKTTATGYVDADLASSCFWFVPVLLERKTSSGWKRAGSTLSLYDGYYKFRIKKAGKYRATATEFGLGTPTLTTCSKASATHRSS